MMLLTKCPKCGKPLSVPLPDDTCEAEAARIARLLRCADCWLEADKTQSNEKNATRGEHGAREGQQGKQSATSLDTPSMKQGSGDQGRTL